MHCAFLWRLADEKKPLPILSFPAAAKLGIKVSELVHSAGKQAQVMEYISRNTPMPAALSLMDLSVEAEAFGCPVSFNDREVPTVTGSIVDDEDSASALEIPSIGAGRTDVCIEAVRQAKKLINSKPVLAGVIGPYSLAGRLMDVTEIMYTCFDEPETVHIVLRKCTDFLISYISAFRDAGADGVIMAEPLAGLLNPRMAQEFSCTYVREIIEAVQSESFPLIYHNCGNAVISMLPELYAMDAAAYHFGNAVDMGEVLKNTPPQVLCMGNISPAEKFAAGSPAAMRLAVKELLGKCGAYPNFILSSGCDIPAHADWNNIMAFFD